MNNNILIAVLLSLGAVAAYLLFVRSPLTADTLIGCGAVLGLLSIASLEYRISWKRLFNRR